MKTIRLSLMMFVQYLMLPVWLLPLLPYLGTLEGGSDWVFAFGLLTGIGTFASPFVCMFADRYLNAEKVLALCNLITAILLGAAFFTESFPVLFVLLLFALVAYMPTWSVSSAIAMAHASAVAFPRYRMLGSLGWVASGFFSLAAARFFGVSDFDMSRRIFAVGSALALLGTVIALLQCATPPKGRGTPLSVADAFGLKAFTLFRNPSFAAFALLLLLAMIPFQWYMVYNPVYLADSGFHYLTLTQNIGQVVEMLFLLAIPFLVRRLGYRRSFILGLVALAVRYAFFSVSILFGFKAGDFGGIVVHGAIFGLVVVVGQMYFGEYAPVALRNQAQGLVILLTSGLGLFLSNLVFHPLLALSATGGHHDWRVPFLAAFAISAALAVAAMIFFHPCEQKGTEP